MDVWRLPQTIAARWVAPLQQQRPPIGVETDDAYRWPRERKRFWLNLVRHDVLVVAGVVVQSLRRGLRLSS